MLEIPDSLSYMIQGSSSEEFEGKWGFKIIDIDGFTEGDKVL